MSIYLDYAATSPIVKYRRSDYDSGQRLNPNANYAHAEKTELGRVANRVRNVIGTKSGKVLFGGTSSQLADNLFYIMTGKPVFIAGSEYEHDAVYRHCEGVYSIDGLRDLITTWNNPNGIQLVVCLMGVNNVTGEVMPIEEIGKLCREHGTYFVCDMTAMVGHYPIPLSLDKWCDAVLISGHKLGTEGNLGCMWVSDRMDELVGGMTIHGTPDLLGAMAMYEAICNAINRVDSLAEQWRDDYDCLSAHLTANGIEHKLVCPERHCCAINAIRLRGINADALQQYLSSKGVYIGIGASACAGSHDFRVLEYGYSMGKRAASEVVRISFGHDRIGCDELHYVADLIKEYKEKFCS